MQFIYAVAYPEGFKSTTFPRTNTNKRAHQYIKRSCNILLDTHLSVCMRTQHLE